MSDDAPNISGYYIRAQIEGNWMSIDICDPRVSEEHRRAYYRSYTHLQMEDCFVNICGRLGLTYSTIKILNENSE